MMSELITDDCPCCHYGTGHKSMNVSVVDFGMLGKHTVTTDIPWPSSGYLTATFNDQFQNNEGSVLLGQIKYCPMCGRKLSDAEEHKN